MAYMHSCSIVYGGEVGLRIICRNSLVRPLSVLPFTLITYLPPSYLNSDLTFDLAPALRTMRSGGSPSTSEIFHICSASFLPLKSGCPVSVSPCHLHSLPRSLFACTARSSLNTVHTEASVHVVCTREPISRQACTLQHEADPLE